MNVARAGSVKIMAVATAMLLALSGPAYAQSVTQYSYDALGRLATAQDGVRASSTYQYDAAGNRKVTKMADQFVQSWNAAGAGHVTGRQEGDAWSATVNDQQSSMWYGPYTKDVPAGAHVAAFRMLVDNNTADNGQVVQLDVWDATANVRLALRNVTRMEWKGAFAYQVFELPFQLDPGSVGHALEFRVYYFGISYVRVIRSGYR